MALESSRLVGDSTMTLPSPVPVRDVAAAGQPVNTAPNCGNSVAGTVLTPNAPAITISGTPISLEHTALVVGSSTIPVQSVESAATQGIGGLILSGLNGGPRPLSVTPLVGSSPTLNSTARRHSEEAFTKSMLTGVV
ncbi:hypothetical protein ABVK25_010932 [Lepraria finkii]|uniref:Uncharacterized protein n=1 Tax=Lepraria finkii TaxID=1340010 RepID=A0ABR4ASY2_9LECA